MREELEHVELARVFKKNVVPYIDHLRKLSREIRKQGDTVVFRKKFEVVKNPSSIKTLKLSILLLINDCNKIQVCAYPSVYDLEPVLVTVNETRCWSLIDFKEKVKELVG